MLQYLAVRDFALIDRMEVDLGPGLNLLTVETGSGKSILIDAVAQLTGDRASVGLIRSGSEAAVLEGLFQLEPDHPALELLRGQVIPVEGGQLVIRRLISYSGSKIFINGAMSTQRFLARLGKTLADIHGQHDQQDLLQALAQLDFLDVFAGHRNLRSEVDDCHRQLRETQSRNWKHWSCGRVWIENWKKNCACCPQQKAEPGALFLHTRPCTNLNPVPSLY